MLTLKNKTLAALAIGTFTLNVLNANAQTQPREWVAKSNSYTKILIDISEKYSPEFGSSQGLAKYDTLVAVPTLANDLAERNEREAALTSLENAKQKEADKFVKQDLDILINQLKLSFKNEDFSLNKKVPFLNATATVFSGLQTLLDDQTPVERSVPPQ